MSLIGSKEPCPYQLIVTSHAYRENLISGGTLITTKDHTRPWVIKRPLKFTPAVQINQSLTQSRWTLSGILLVRHYINDSEKILV